MYVYGQTSGVAGYSDTTRALLHAWRAQGRDVGFFDAYVSRLGTLTDPVIASFKRDPHPGEPTLGIYPIPQLHTFATILPCGAYYTAWEAEPLQERELQHFRGRRLIVPSTFCARIAARHGLEAVVVPHGRDAAFTPGPSKSERFTFLDVGAWNNRKGHDLVVRAFSEEFQAHEARLIIHSYPPDWRDAWRLLKAWGAGRNVVLDHDEYDAAHMAQLYRDCDAYVSAAHGEGFCKTALEALACARSVIIPDYGGHMDFCSDRTGVIVPTTMGPAPIESEFWPGAQWGNPDVKALRAAMRYLHDNPDEARKRGAEGPKAVEHLTWDASAKALWEAAA